MDRGQLWCRQIIQGSRTRDDTTAATWDPEKCWRVWSCWVHLDLSESSQVTILNTDPFVLILVARSRTFLYIRILRGWWKVLKFSMRRITKWCLYSVMRAPALFPALSMERRRESRNGSIWSCGTVYSCFRETFWYNGPACTLCLF